MPKRLFKHKLLLDENMPHRIYLPLINERYDVKHIVGDYKLLGIRDKTVYERARREKRLLITYNVKDFAALLTRNDDPGIIGVSANLPIEQIDTKLTAFLRRNTMRSQRGKVTMLTGETEF